MDLRSRISLSLSLKMRDVTKRKCWKAGVSKSLNQHSSYTQTSRRGKTQRSNEDDRETETCETSIQGKPNDCTRSRVIESTENCEKQKIGMRSVLINIPITNGCGGPLRQSLVRDNKEEDDVVMERPEK
ncbi:uncharacterized protein LOC129309017 [Prosopis cineraria]|uniref:uncharacterized protein LOC129309017 n=1 Tax=Prosopis cineraria TaxID=364024 RepID=UPI00240E9EEB|nr:uncharacterized protein LOC129309017 [Prosopis cineraria]